ncbi:baeRF7 domain-containing protein [Salisaeta longa]|uniref:baeRF7 domain-containing protein n=1 Tax=Salisaeta longa TaxID=503170 RepID=UPI00048D6CBB|nr:hypothetical protein [Salisaeta longa]
MDRFSRDHLRQLAEHQGAPCASIYLPSVRHESDAAQNVIRYKNLLRDVRDQLRAQDYREPAIDDLLDEARRKIDDTAFWRHMAEGLAVFIDASGTRFFRLPLSFDEVAVVGSRFHLKPLFPILATNNRFYILALHKSNVRLYQGTHQAIGLIDSDAIPDDIVEAVRQYEDAERELQQHTANRTSRGRQDAAFHGHTASEDDSARAHEELRRFFQQIDDGIQEQINDDSVPMVLAGVAEYLPVYREVNSYSGLVADDIIAGNPEDMREDQLHEQAWAMVEPIFLETQKEALDAFDQYFHQDGGALASEDFHEIVPACVYSRVDTLFVPIGQHRWGRFDATDNVVTLHDERTGDNEDLLNYAAVQAYLNGATVHALRPENMPGGRSIAATFRFPADVSAAERG